MLFLKSTICIRYYVEKYVFAWSKIFNTLKLTSIHERDALDIPKLQVTRFNVKGISLRLR